MRYISTAFLAASALLALSARACAQDPPISDLGTLGGVYSSGSKVNGRGAVIGYSSLPDSFGNLAFFHDGASMHPLTLGGSFSYAADLNDAGMVVGGSFTAGDAQYQAFFYFNGQARMLSLGGTFGMAEDINESGQVVGYSALAGDDEVHAFLYDSSTDQMTDLGTLGGSASYALRVNEAGQVIGYSYTDGDSTTQGFRYSGGQLLSLSLSAGTSWVSDINSTGQVVGAGITPDGQFHAYLFDGVRTIDLGTLGGTFSEAVGINEAGVVIGNSRLAGDMGSSGFVFDGTNLVQLTLGGSNSRAVDINNAGVVAGEATLPGEMSYTAFIYHNGQYTPINLGGNYAYAVALNEQGDLIGAGRPAGSFDTFAFKHCAGGLNVITLGGSFSAPYSINDRGDVTGESGTFGDSETHAFLAPGGSVPADTQAPVTSAAPSSSPNDAGWFRSSVLLELNASDEGGSGVREIRYSVNGGSVTVAEGSSVSCPFASDGVYSIQFFAVDNAGNEESPKSFTVKIDKTAPTVSIATDPRTLSPANKKMRAVTVSGRISDGLSGVASTSFRVVDEYGVIQPTGSVTVGADGLYSFKVDLMASREPKDKDGRIYRIFVRAHDAAGNESESSALVTTK